jgi:hypothetical protein
VNTEPQSWTRWPHPLAAVDVEILSVGVEKSASAEMLYSDPSIESLLAGVVEEIPAWERELPEAVKTAAVQLGGRDLLPKVTAKNIWRHPNAHPLTLLLMLVDKYGQEAMEWEPEALRSTLKKDGIQLSESVWTKILAGRVVVASGSPWRQWEQFHWVSYGLAGRAPNFVYLERPEIGFLMAAVDTMKIIDRQRPFAEDIDKFVAAVLRERGIMYAPAPLDFAQYELDDRRIVCNNCGTRERDDGDIKCVACGSKDLKRLPGPFEHLRAPTKKLFDARKSQPLEAAVAGLSDSSEDRAAYKLLVHNEYRNEVRAQLLSQLRMLKKGE